MAIQGATVSLQTLEVMNMGATQTLYTITT